MKHVASVPSVSFTIAEARAYLNVGRNTMQKLIATKAIPSFVIGERNRRVHKHALDEYMARLERENAGDAVA